jgi:hypothetical protein
LAVSKVSNSCQVLSRISTWKSCGDKYALTSGTFKECEDYQKKDEVEQEKLGICVDYEIREQ